jgi:hypothetical protein
LFLQFLTPKGNPAYVRPELVGVLCGYHTTIAGRWADATRIGLTSGDQVFVQGHADAIHDAIDAWYVENTPKLMVGELSPLDTAGPSAAQPLGASPVRFAE